MAKKDQPAKIKSKKHLARKQREARQTKAILIATISIGVIIVGLVAYGLIDQLISRPRTPITSVGDTVIRVSEFESQVQYTRVSMLNEAYQYYLYYQQFGEFGQSFLETAQSIASQLSQPVTLGTEVLDNMIDNILIREAADEMGITTSDEEINELMQSAFGFYPNGTATPTQTATIISTPTLSETQYALVTPTFTPTATDQPTETPEVSPTPIEDVDEDSINENSEDETTIEEPTSSGETAEDEAGINPTITTTPTITLTPTPYTTQVFGQNLKDFNDLYSTYNFSVEDLRKMIEVQVLRDKLIEEITADLEPVKEEVWARHILVETEEEAQDILAQLEDGGDFHELTAEYSIDESNASEGGDLGWFDNETMVSEFSEAAFSLDIGEISEPVETSFGFHIIQVLGKRESQVLTDELQEKKLELFSTWLSERRNSRDDIIYYDGWESFIPTTPEINQDFLIELYSQDLGGTITE